MEKPKVAIRLKLSGKEVEKKEERETKRVISKYLCKEIQHCLGGKKMEHHSIQMIAQSCKSRKREIIELPQKTEELEQCECGFKQSYTS